jgi:hypothetical protein
MVSAALLVAVASSNCFAVDKGQTEVNLFGSVMSTKDEAAGSKATNMTLVRVGAGHFLKDFLSVGADAMVVYSKSGGTSSSTTTVFNVNSKIHIMPSKPVVPYAGIQLGVLGTDSGSSSSTGYNFGAMAGINFFVSENASFNIELNGRHDTLKPDAGKDTKQDTVALLLGLSYYFGK